MFQYDGDIGHTGLVKIYHLPSHSGAGLLLSSDCITSSIKMLGTGLMGPVNISPSPNFALFKSHKTFPRRTAQTDARTLSQSIGQRHSQIHEYQDSYKSSQKIRSWIPEPSAPHVAPDHDSPLTPPINMQDHEERWTEERTHADAKLSSQQKSRDRGGMSTPTLQHRPLTPETTPPRLDNLVRPLHLPLTSRDPSLRTESFETARETLSADESLDIESPAMPTARRSWSKQAEQAKPRDFGLGLDLESEDDDPTPTDIKPKYSLKKYDFNKGNTTWSAEKGTANGLGIKTGDDDIASCDLRLKKLRNRQRMPTHPLPRGMETDEETVSLVPRALSLRQRVEKCQQNLSPSTERFAEQIDWPLRGESIDNDKKLREVDLRRFSQASASSTVVEAMVFDTPPQRRKTLRHTGKIPATNSDNTQAGQSNRSSLISTSSVRRRLPRNSITPEREQRRSDATDASGSVNSIVPGVRQVTVPVIHVPKRGSSLRSLALGGGNDSKTMSLTSPQQQLTRPTTAPEASTEYFDLPRHEHRRTSALIPSALTKREGQMLKETQAAKDEQASSEISKGISVPSASAPSSQGQQGQPQPVLHLSEPADPQGVTPDRYVTGEWSALRPQSALVTPFSLRSAHSSTPGTLEVNEATAISIYPHTNKSILVIQQMTGGDPNDPPGHSAIIAANANISLSGTVTPTLIHETRQAINSPLKNPRAPPQPPDFKLIPPTPLNGPPTEESNSQQSPTSPAKARLNRPVAIMKRALSARRYSESFISPLSRSLSRRNTIDGRRPPIGDDPDSRLHPFWRPRGFWDDLSESSSDSDSDFGNVPNYTDVRVSRKNHAPDISSNQPLTRSVSLTRRFATSISRKTSKNYSPYSYIRSHSRSLADGSQEPAPPRKKYSFASLDNNRSYEFLPQPARQREVVPMPRLGYRVQFIGLKGLAEKMEKAKVRREEGRRERAREKLRGSIGVVRLGDSGLVSGGCHDLRR